jgi:hypothetical protein
MAITKSIKVQRRAFLTATPLLILGAGVINSSSFSPQSEAKDPGLSEKLSSAEREIVNGSTMSGDMDNFWGKGYSCAETGLMVALRFMKKPEELVWTAGGFGGGMGQGDLCGFLTAGIMAIGLHAGTLKAAKSDVKTVCGQKVKEYWTWWTSMAPLHCSEIREGRQDFGICQRLGKLAAAKLETLIST